MPRTHIHLTEEQLWLIKKEVKRTGLKQSEVIRRVLDIGLSESYHVEDRSDNGIGGVSIITVNVESSGKSKVIIRPFNIRATMDNTDVFGCKLYAENDALDKIEISDNREGPFVHYTKESPFSLGDLKAGEQRTIFVRSTDNFKQKGTIKFIGEQF